MKKQILLTVLLLLMLFTQMHLEGKSPAAIPTNSTINGYVKDSESEETLIGATVFLVGTKKGAYTNKSGFFSLTDIIPGEYTVRVSMIGYSMLEEKVKLTKGEVLRKDFKLFVNVIKTKEISVEAEKEVETRQISISKVNIPISQIKEIRIGGESDVFRTLQLLPGVLTSSQISSGLYIRGGSPDQNLVLLDGSTVYNPSHLFGFISTFNSDAIKDVELIKGGYPAEYGSRLSSVINITQKDGNKNKVEGLGSLGLLSSKLSLEGPSPIGDGSWFIGGRRTYFELIKSAIDTDPDNPIPDFNFYDLNAKYSMHFGKNDKMFVSGFLSRDNFNYNSGGLEMDMFMGNKSGSARWTHIFGDNLFAVANFSASHYNNGMNQDYGGYLMKIENYITDYSLKLSSEWFVSDDLTLNTGGEVSNYIFGYERNFSGESEGADQGTSQGSKVNLIYHDWTYSAYTSASLRIADVFTMQTGVRANYWDYSEKATIDPRFALRYQYDESLAIKASWGIFHQYLRLAGDENFTLFDTWLPTDRTVEAAKATHYILSFETKPLEDWDFNFDVYYKNLSNISEINQTNLNAKDVRDVFYNGNGESYGLELFLQRKVGKLAGWIGYGLGWVTARFDSINGGREFRPKYDRRHDLKLVLQYELDKNWQFGATFMLQSGQSYTGATSRFQAGLPGDNNGFGKVIPSQRYGLRLPASHQLNLSGSYTTTLAGLPFRMILDIYNVYNRRDILMRFYNTENDESVVEDVRLLPILPTFSFEIKF